MSAVRIQAPAKLNLGLSILGKRSDGYHEIDTILAMIDLVDSITVREIAAAGISISGMDDVPLESNLMTHAVRSWCELAGKPVAYHIQIDKRIPSPAGLGGGSSDAAAILRALDALHPGALSTNEMHGLAVSLGADCPFFLGTACARASGIGTTLNPLPPPADWAVVVVPPQSLKEKTATLYGAIETQDYCSRQGIDRLAAKLPQIPGVPANSFTRAALNTFPLLSIATDALTTVSGTWALSGAGPAVYALTPTKSEAASWAEDLRELLSTEFLVLAPRFLQEPPRPEQFP